MSSSNDINMEEIPLEDDERDSIEYRILMAYAQRRLSANKYGKFLRKEANVQKSLSLIRREVETEYQDNKDGPSQIKILPAEKSDEKTNVDHIADRLAKLVTSRSQPSPSDVSLKQLYNQGPQRQGRNATGGSQDEENDEDNIIHTIVALLAQSGDQLEEKIKKDKSFYQYLINRLSYTFFERLIDLTLTAVSADSTSETEGQAQCTKAAFALEVATRLTAVDSHPMNMVLGFGVKYLREHFTPWIRHEGGWEKALTLLDQEEIE
ncbi:apoptosis facilitator Bcl-2-like protein 14 [Nothoprocta perdicaria]|uniref:apoptosis facilitator Bcl-2-like protein 14 n=1 Tax=Nothoprocta perdicaria TaxID=30464 RepID=UPI000E1C2AB3|nr:apoptosis facilitator Bcl-2-like protein 14 [Nothoprocta perdicaria]